MKSITALLVGLTTAATLYTAPAFAQDNSCNLEEKKKPTTLDDFLENEIAPIVVPFGTLPPEPTVVTDPIEHLAFRLRDHGYEVDGKGIVTVLRVMYLEGAYDSQISSKEAQRESDLMIAASILNRYNFDKDHDTNKFGGKQGLVGVVQKPWQYSAFNPRHSDFSDESYNFENGDLRITTKRVQDKTRIRELAAALIDIASGNIEDPTSGALYYKTDGVNDWWDGSVAFWLDEKTECKREYVGKHGSHEVFGVNCN